MINPCAIIPIFNHGAEAGPVIQALLNYDLSVILIDDASDSKNAQIIDEYVKSNEKVFLVRHSSNQGKEVLLGPGF